ncbi:MAG TPA: fumarylacetoacetate hydrolase family protein [Gemmatimonadaceae bacterium]
MHIISFVTGSSRRARVGAAIDDTYVLDFERAFDGDERPANHVDWLDMDSAWFQQSRNLFTTLTRGSADMSRAASNGWLVKRSDVTPLAPVPRPGKIICIGLNYRDHAAEINMAIPERPIVFSKFTTAVAAPGDAIVIPSVSRQVDYEAELAVVIGRRAKSVSASNALDYVLGYTAFNDVTARDFQASDGQWQRSKSCDTFAPMGPAIVTVDAIPDAQNLPIKLTLNGATMQESNTNQLIFGVPELIEFVSQSITLEPGDVIATGTPPGVGAGRKPPVFLKAGDVVEVEIEGLGRLTNVVAAD